jgi:hypothetical protein
MNNGETYTLDELKIGTTYEAVIPASAPTGTFIIIK